MPQSLWTDQEAQVFLDRYAADHGEDIALRVFTSRLIGRDRSLVLHGGGNTSCKTKTRDILGRELEVLAVKGSGWDLVDIEPPGLPLVELEPLRRLMALDSMSDEQMVNEVRRQLLLTSAPNPSVEALLHAALPHRFVDHTHADAIVTLSNQPDGADLIREALGGEVGMLDWIMPGFPLAKAVAAAYAENEAMPGIVLLHHGIFSFGETAQESYERMIELVHRAESFIDQRAPKVSMLVGPATPPGDADLAAVLPVLRGALADGEGVTCHKRMVADARRDQDLCAFSADRRARALVQLGPLTPDHVIRTKGPYLYLTRAEAGDRAAVDAALATYAKNYEAYFEANKHRVSVPLTMGPPTMGPPTMLDTKPRVAVIEGMGLVAFGASAGAAGIAADIAEHTLRAKARAQEVGQYKELPPAELFDMEYWSLEQAKLGKKKAPELAGQVAMVTGAGGAIGMGICKSLAAAGAAMVLVEIDQERADAAVEVLRKAVPGAACLPLGMDVTDEAAVATGMDAAVARFGGLDILVPNAGIAHVQSVAEMDLAAFRKVLDVNLCGTMTVLQAAARVFAAQNTGGAVVVQASKNVFAPGADFGAYSASKAGQHQLGKVAALELAPYGVRVNMVNADAVFGDEEVPSGLWQMVGPARMRARGLDADGLKDYYRERSMLKRTVTPEDVGEAVLYLASARSAATTGVTMTVDSGVAAAFPR